MAKPTTGIVSRIATTNRHGKRVSRWLVRFTGMVDGKRKDVRKRVDSNAEATALLNELHRKHAAGSLGVSADKITFRQAADRFEKSELVAAVYRDGRKVRGYLESNLENQKRILGVLRDYFGARKLRAISPGDLETFKRDRLETPITR